MNTTGAERFAETRERRRASFLDPDGWQQSLNHPANVWRDVQIADGTTRHVTIFESDGWFRIYIYAKPTDYDVFPSERFTDRDAAIRFAFDELEKLPIKK